MAIVAAAGLGGYLLTCALYPAPILVHRHSVPALRGMAADTALHQLAALGLRGRLADSLADPMVAAGQISWQSPAPETVLPEGAAVQLGVSLGAPSVAVPNLVDLDVQLALDVLAAAGLRAGTVDSAVNAAPPGTVVGTHPVAGSTLPTGTAVDLSISAGPPPVPAPNLVGLSLKDARDRLSALGLRVGRIDLEPSGKEGTVLVQQPLPGAYMKRESPVDLTIGGNQP